MTLAHWHSSDSTQRELSNEYQHGRVQTVFFKYVCGRVSSSKVASALKGLKPNTVLRNPGKHAHLILLSKSFEMNTNMTGCSFK